MGYVRNDSPDLITEISGGTVSESHPEPHYLSPRRHHTCLLIANVTMPAKASLNFARRQRLNLRKRFEIVSVERINA